MKSTVEPDGSVVLTYRDDWKELMEADLPFTRRTARPPRSKDDARKALAVFEDAKQSGAGAPIQVVMRELQCSRPTAYRLVKRGREES